MPIPLLLAAGAAGAAGLSAYQGRRQEKKADAAQQAQLDLLRKQYESQQAERSRLLPYQTQGLEGLRNYQLPTSDGVNQLFESSMTNAPRYEAPTDVIDMYQRNLGGNIYDSIPAPSSTIDYSGLPNLPTMSFRDPSALNESAFYEPGLRDTQEAARSGLAARGLLASPVGAGIENEAVGEYNRRWREGMFNRELQRRQQLAGEQSLGFNVALQGRQQLGGERERQAAYGLDVNRLVGDRALQNRLAQERAGAALTNQASTQYSADRQNLDDRQRAAMQYLQLLQQPAQAQLGVNQMLAGINPGMPNYGPQADFYGNQANMYGQSAQGYYNAAGNFAMMPLFMGGGAGGGGANPPSSGGGVTRFTPQGYGSGATLPQVGLNTNPSFMPQASPTGLQTNQAFWR